jgi:hypothetical protein
VLIHLVCAVTLSVALNAQAIDVLKLGWRLCTSARCSHCHALTAMQIRQIVSIGNCGLVSFDLSSEPSTRYCTWANRRHRGNFTFLTADLWYNTIEQHCWDKDCRQRYKDRWLQHRYQLPDHCAQLRRLFDDPHPIAAELQHMFADPFGRRAQDAAAAGIAEMCE